MVKFGQYFRCAPAARVSSSGCATTSATRFPASSNRIAADHARAEIGETLRFFGRAGVMRANSLGFRSEAEGECYVEGLERPHLPVEPRFGVRAQPVRPAQPRTQIAHPEIAQPANAVIQPVIFKMKPLADSQLRRVFVEMLQGEFWRPVLPQKPHVKVPVIGRALGF